MTTQGSVVTQSHRTWSGLEFGGLGGGSECLRFLRTKVKTAVVLDTVGQSSRSLGSPLPEGQVLSWVLSPAETL